MATRPRARLSNDSDPNSRSSRSLRAPILNPYDQFPQSEFDAWIGDLTGALKRALGYHDAPVPLEPSLDLSRSSFADFNDLEQLSPADESSYSEVDDSFAEIRERRAVNKGKARDPDEGPGFGSGIGNRDQPIEIDLDSDMEKQREDEEYEEYYEGGEEEDEQEEVEVEDEMEEEQSWDEEDTNENLSPHVNYESDTEARRLEVHQRVVGAGDDEDEYEKRTSPVSDAEEASLQPNHRDGIEGDDEIIELSSSSDTSEQGDEQEANVRAAGPQRDRQSMFPRLEDPNLQQQDYSEDERYEDEDDQREMAAEKSEVDEIASSDDEKQPEAGDTSFPPAPESPAELEYPVDLPDPWYGPQTYAEDLYTGGDISPGSKDPNQLGFEAADPQAESVDRGDAPIPGAAEVLTEDKPVPVLMEQDNHLSEATETAEKVEHIFTPAHDEGTPSAPDSQGDLLESHGIASGELQATSTIPGDAGESFSAVHDAASGMPTDVGSGTTSNTPVVDVRADYDADNRVFEASASVASIGITPNENTEEEYTPQTDTVPEKADSVPPLLEVSPTQDIGEWIFGSLPTVPLSFEAAPTPAPSAESVSARIAGNLDHTSSPAPPDAIVSSAPPHTFHVSDDSAQDSSTRPSAEASFHVVELSQSFDQNAGLLSDDDLRFDQPSDIFDLYGIPQAITEEPLSESPHSGVDQDQIRETGEQPPDNTDMQVSPALDIEEIRDSASPHIIDASANMQVSEEIISEDGSNLHFEVTSPPVVTDLSQSPTPASQPSISLSEGKGEPQEPLTVEDLGPVAKHSIPEASPSSPEQIRQSDKDHLIEERAADFLQDSKVAFGEQSVTDGEQTVRINSGMPGDTSDENEHLDAPAPETNQNLAKVTGQELAFIISKSDIGQRSEGDVIPPAELPAQTHDFQPMTMRLVRKATDPILLADPYPASLSTPLDYADIAKDMQEEGSSDETDLDTSMASSSTAEKDMDDGSAMEQKNAESSTVLGQGSVREDSISNRAIRIAETHHDIHSLMDGHDLDQDADGELDPDFVEHGLPVNEAALRDEGSTAVPPKENVPRTATAELVSSEAEAPPPEKVTSPPCAVATDESNGTEAASFLQNDVFAPSVKDNSAELPAILIIKRKRESDAGEVSSPIRQRNDALSPTSKLPRPSKRKRSKSPSQPPVMTRSMTSRVAGTKGSAPSSSRTRSSEKQDKIQKGVPFKRSASLRSSAAKKPDSTSSSGTSTASRMLRPGSRSTSRASSVSSNAPSDQPSSTMQPSPTPTPIQPQPSLFHTHSHTRPLHHNHHRALPPPVQTQLQARKPSPSNPSIAESSPTTQMMPSLPTPKPLGYSPVTRSHCRYHKISLPKEEDGPRVYFLVPGCSLGDRELMEEEKIEDHGHASFEDSSRIIRDFGLMDFSPYLIGILRQLVGVDLLREQEIYYLPQPGENLDVLRPKTASEKLSLARIPSKDVPNNYEHGGLRGSPSISHASIASPTSSRPPPSAAESASTTASTARKSSGNDVESLSVLSDTDTGRSDDEVNPGSASTSGRPLTASQEEPGVRSDRLPLRPRRSKRLGSDAAAYKPQESDGVTNSGDDSMRVSRTRKSFRRGVKRSRKADSAREEDENRTTKKLKTWTSGRSSVSEKDSNT